MISAPVIKPFFQPKLTINQPNDIYEQEADAMADKVMRMKEPEEQQSFFSPSSNYLQRKCGQCEEEEKQLHRKENSSGEVHANNNFENYVSSLNNSGSPLPQASKQFFEPRFGTDFSNVRIHNNSIAAKSATSINALAYTSGSNIVFNEGQYAPGTESGDRLLAHELTHVVQQSNNTAIQSKLIQRSDKPETYCQAFMELVRYEKKYGKLWVLYRYNSFTLGIFGDETLIDLNHDIPSEHGDVDVDWMFRLAFIQYPFILASVYTPSMAEGFGLISSYIGYMGAKAFWNTLRAPFPQWKWEYGSIFDEANWNSASAIVDWIHHEKSLREIFAPAVQVCEQNGY